MLTRLVPKNGKKDGECYSCRTYRGNGTSAPLRAVLGYRNTRIVLRIQKELREKGEEITRDEAEALFRSTLKFLWGTQNGGSTTPNPEEDEGWHTMLLFTKDYQKFCQKFFGRFIHHNPV